MATPFKDIYNLFMTQVEDYKLGTMNPESLDVNLELWLMSAIAFFPNCRHDLFDFNLETRQFNDDLAMNEKFILAKFMVFVYLDTQLVREDLLKQSLNSKDYRMYSPANQIKAILELKQQVNAEANTLLSRYFIRHLKDYFK